MTVKQLTEQHLKFLSSTGGCTGSSESIQVKMPHCWKSHVAAHMFLLKIHCSLFIMLCFGSILGMDSAT